MVLSFSYLNGLIPLIVFEYCFVLLICRCSRFCCCEICREDDIPYEAENDNGYTAEIDMGNPNTPMSRKTHLKFEDTYESFHPWFKYILFFTRFLSFYYICGVSVVANYIIVGGHQWFTFSMWNAELLAIYFGCAVVSSVYGIVYGEDHSIPSTIIDVEGGSRERRTRVLWSTPVINFGRTVQILFEVCGGTAVYMTVIAFSFLNQNFIFWNVSMNFITIMVILLELFLNNLYVRADHFPFNLSWGFLYLIFIWPVVFFGRLKAWPYHFLELDTKYCYLYYSLLVIADIVFYFIFYAMSKVKFYIRKSLYQMNDRTRASKNLDAYNTNIDAYDGEELQKNEIPEKEMYKARIGKEHNEQKDNEIEEINVQRHMDLDEDPERGESENEIEPEIAEVIHISDIEYRDD
jgi:hypothetical protein